MGEGSGVRIRMARLGSEGLQGLGGEEAGLLAGGAGLAPVLGLALQADLAVPVSAGLGHFRPAGAVRSLSRAAAGASSVSDEHGPAASTVSHAQLDRR